VSARYRLGYIQVFFALAVHTAVLAHADGGRINVVATIYPLAAIAEAVGGDAVRTSALLPAGASPHAYDPIPSDLVRLSRADLLVTVGGGLDTWADRLRSAIETKPVVVTLAQLAAAADASHDELLHVDESVGDLRDHDHGHGHHDEPHVWLDPLFVADRLVPAMAAAIIAAGADDAEGVAERARLLVEDLHALDRRIRATLAGPGATEYIAFHNAWGHFAARYALDELGVLEEAGGEEPTPRAIAGIIRSARRQGVHAILVEPQLPARVAEIIAAEFDGITVLVDPLGAATTPGRTTYVELMEFNAEAFARALAAEAAP